MPPHSCPARCWAESRLRRSGSRRPDAGATCLGAPITSATSDEGLDVVAVENSICLLRPASSYSGYYFQCGIATDLNTGQLLQAAQEWAQLSGCEAGEWNEPPPFIRGSSTLRFLVIDGDEVQPGAYTVFQG